MTTNLYHAKSRKTSFHLQTHTETFVKSEGLNSCDMFGHFFCCAKSALCRSDGALRITSYANNLDQYEMPSGLASHPNLLSVSLRKNCGCLSFQVDKLVALCMIDISRQMAHDVATCLQYLEVSCINKSLVGKKACSIKSASVSLKSILLTWTFIHVYSFHSALQMTLLLSWGFIQECNFKSIASAEWEIICKT